MLKKLLFLATVSVLLNSVVAMAQTVRPGGIQRMGDEAMLDKTDIGALSTGVLCAKAADSERASGIINWKLSQNSVKVMRFVPEAAAYTEIFVHAPYAVSAPTMTLNSARQIEMCVTVRTR